MASIEASGGETQRNGEPGQGPMFVVGLGHGSVHWVYMVLTVLTPAIKDSFDLSYSQVAWLHALFHISSFVGNAASGVLVDMIERRGLFQMLAVFAGGVALLGSGESSGFLILCLMMTLIGIADKFWHPAAISFLGREYPKRRGYAMSIHAVGASLGDFVAPLAVTSLMLGILGLGWREAATISAVVPLVVGVLLLIFVVPRDRPTGAGADAAKKAMSLADYWIGLKALCADRTILGLSLMGGFRTAGLFGIFAFLPLYLAEVLQLPEERQGLALATMQIGGFIAGPLAGMLSDKIGRQPIVVGGLSTVTMVIFGLTFVGDATIFIVGITVLGFALYAIRPVVHAWMMDIAPDRHGGSAASVLFAIQTVMTGGFVVLAGEIADEFGLVAVFYAIAASMLLANLMAIILPGRKPAEA